MTIATPLSLRWERAQHIDRSAIEPLGTTIHTGRECSPSHSAGEHLGPTFWVTPSIGTHSCRDRRKQVSLCRQGRPRSVMFMGLATPCVANQHHSMVAQPFLVNVSCPAHYQHNLEPRPRLPLIGQTTSSRLTITELSVAFHSVLVIV